MIVDLTKTIKDKMSGFPGDPVVRLEQIKHFIKDGYNDYLLTTNMHTGTHIDGLNHMGNGPLINDIDLTQFMGIGRVADPLNYIYQGEDVVVIECHGHYLEENFIRQLIEHPLKFIVIDNDSVDTKPYFLHKLLFSKQIYIVENAINLNRLPKDTSFEIFAIPLKIESDSSPVRLFAKIK
ncbi:MAG: cyclase family protein [Acholeplasmataceae bacterium]|nr:cyclase family protein [Acholeplasmataceae bacterium]